MRRGAGLQAALPSFFPRCLGAHRFPVTESSLRGVERPEFTNSTILALETHAMVLGRPRCLSGEVLL